MAALVALEADAGNEAVRLVAPLMERPFVTEPSPGAADQWLVDTTYVVDFLRGLLTRGLADRAVRVRATELREALAPHASRVVISGVAVTVKGCVAYHLGLLCAALDDRSAAQEYLRQAVAIPEGIDAIALTLGSRLALARLDGWDADRLDVAAELRARGLAGPMVEPAHPSFARDGAMWTVSYRGRSVRLRDVKGLADLAVLVASTPERAEQFVGVLTRSVPIREYMSPGNLVGLVGVAGFARLALRR
jgi:hypothetical protein